MYAFRAIALLAAIGFASALPLDASPNGAVKPGVPGDLAVPKAPLVPATPLAPPPPKLTVPPPPKVPEPHKPVVAPQVPAKDVTPVHRRDTPYAAGAAPKTSPTPNAGANPQHAATPNTGAATNSGDAARPPFPDVCQGATAQLQPIIVRLKASIAIQEQIDVDVVAGILNEVIAVLTDLVAELQALIHDPVAFVLSVSDVAALLYTLLSLVLLTLVTVVSSITLIGTNALSVITPLVLQIGSLLSTVIGCSLEIVPDLLISLLAAIVSLIPCLYKLGLLELCKVLGLPNTPQ